MRTDIDVIPTVYQGEKVLIVKDFLGLIPQPIMLRGVVLQLIGLMDGNRSVRDIQLELVRMQGGVFISSEDIEGMIAQLDKAFLIDNEHYQLEKNRIVQDYARNKMRSAALAGKSYPGEPDKLAPYIQSILDCAEAQPDAFERKRIAAVVAPHIDLDVGRKIYARAYQVLREFSPKKILLLGTGHNLQDSFFSLTAKDYVTPLGRAKTERDWVERLKNICPPGIIAPHDIDHKNEHSLEFQVLFLQYLFGDGVKILPILCGSFHKVLHRFSRPGEIPGMPDFISGLQHFLAEEGGSVLVVAGVDFSHIGPKFGHRQPASSMIQEAKKHDRSLLDAICCGDVQTFWSEVQGVNNRYNVCGFSTLALLLELIPGRTGHMLGYEFWMEEATQSAVSFAALAFPAE